jgi:hypothetical protein
MRDVVFFGVDVGAVGARKVTIFSNIYFREGLYVLLQLL